MTFDLWRTDRRSITVRLYWALLIGAYFVPRSRDWAPRWFVVCVGPVSLEVTWR